MRKRRKKYGEKEARRGERERMEKIDMGKKKRKGEASGGEHEEME